MRRMQAILVIVALLSTPLALLARATGRDSVACNDGMCCLPHGSHHSTPYPAPQGPLHEGMSCEHGAASRIIECTMNAGHHRTDYGFLSPIAPTKPSALAAVAALHPPNMAVVRSAAQNISAGFVTNLFQPPRT